MINGSEKRNLQLAFELQNSHACEKRSNSVVEVLFVFVFVLFNVICYNKGNQLKTKLWATIQMTIEEFKVVFRVTFKTRHVLQVFIKSHSFLNLVLFLSIHKIDQTQS